MRTPTPPPKADLQLSDTTGILQQKKKTTPVSYPFLSGEPPPLKKNPESVPDCMNWWCAGVIVSIYNRMGPSKIKH